MNELAFNKPKMQWRVASTSNVNLDERKFNVDSGASVHFDEQDGFVTKRIGNSQCISTSHDGDHGEWVGQREELETVNVSRRPTTVITVNGSVNEKNWKQSMYLDVPRR